MESRHFESRSGPGAPLTAPVEKSSYTPEVHFDLYSKQQQQQQQDDHLFVYEIFTVWRVNILVHSVKISSQKEV